MGEKLGHECDWIHESNWMIWLSGKNNKKNYTNLLLTGYECKPVKIKDRCEVRSHSMTKILWSLEVKSQNLVKFWELYEVTKQATRSAVKNFLLKLKYLPWRSRHSLCDFSQVDPSCQIHLSWVDFEDIKTSFLIWWRELNFPVNSSGSKQGRVQDVDTIRSHNNL